LVNGFSCKWKKFLYDQLHLVHPVLVYDGMFHVKILFILSISFSQSYTQMGKVLVWHRFGEHTVEDKTGDEELNLESLGYMYSTKIENLNSSNQK
jgi:hypothetical protein